MHYTDWQHTHHCLQKQIKLCIISKVCSLWHALLAKSNNQQLLTAPQTNTKMMGLEINIAKTGVMLAGASVNNQTSQHQTGQSERWMPSNTLDAGCGTRGLPSNVACLEIRYIQMLEDWIVLFYS